jgi:hypothetical protein
MWEAAQEAEQAAAEECRRRDALWNPPADGVLQRPFWWRDPHFEAELELFFRPGQHGDAWEWLGCRLRRLDYEMPSARRRLEIEDRFQQEMLQAGPLYERVMHQVGGIAG